MIAERTREIARPKGRQVDEAYRQTVDMDVRDAFNQMWHDGYDGKELAKAFVRIAAEVVRDECPDDLAELRDQI